MCNRREDKHANHNYQFKALPQFHQYAETAPHTNSISHQIHIKRDIKWLVMRWWCQLSLSESSRDGITVNGPIFQIVTRITACLPNPVCKISHVTSVDIIICTSFSNQTIKLENDCKNQSIFMRWKNRWVIWWDFLHVFFLFYGHIFLPTCRLFAYARLRLVGLVCE